MSAAAADDLHSAWAQLFATTLAQCGVAQAVISPGSRSTPLALALAAHLPTTVLIDERAAAFFALGQARASGRASVLLATSGSAPGHWLPAVMEARESGLPLLLLSADRPWELQQAQASQTVDQQRLFGHHANAYFELGLPDAHPAALRALPRIAAQAVLATRYPRAGAVQVNAHFRKPLEPQPRSGHEPWLVPLQALADAGAPRLVPPRAAPAPEAVALLVAQVRAAPQGVLVAGPLPAPLADALRAALQRFLAASGYVLLAEATSQLRFGLEAEALHATCGAFDALLREPVLRERLRPDLALEIGAPAVSAQWLAWAESDHAPPRLVLPGERPADPAGGALGMLLGPVAELLDAVSAQLLASPPAGIHAARAAAYRRRWHAAEAAAWAARQRADAAADAAVNDAAVNDAAVDDAAAAAAARTTSASAIAPAARLGAAVPASERLHEHHIAPLLRAALPAGALLAVGNSGPVRDLDHDLPPDGRPLTLLHQRGAAGIDGLVAGAAGARSVSTAPLALLLGDISLLHDAGGLAAAAAVRGPLAIVVVNNDGGRIFERLPLGRDPAVAAARERLFVVPHGRAFGGLAATWGVGHARVDTPAALAEALARALAADHALLIEACPVPGGSAQRAQLLAAMAAAASGAVSATLDPAEKQAPQPRAIAPAPAAVDPPQARGR